MSEFVYAGEAAKCRVFKALKASAKDFSLAPPLTGMKKTGILALTVLLGAAHARAQEQPPLDRSRDRGAGVPSSMFGTYIRAGELIVYPYYEYYRDNDYEYEAGELGYVGTTELRSRYRAHEGLFFLGYGITENVAVEFELATEAAWLEKSPLDTSAMPARLTDALTRGRDDFRPRGNVSPAS